MPSKSEKVGAALRLGRLLPGLCCALLVPRLVGVPNRDLSGVRATRRSVLAKGLGDLSVWGVPTQPLALGVLFPFLVSRTGCQRLLAGLGDSTCTVPDADAYGLDRVTREEALRSGETDSRTFGEERTLLVGVFTRVEFRRG